MKKYADSTSSDGNYKRPFSVKNPSKSPATPQKEKSSSQDIIDHKYCLIVDEVDGLL